MHFACLRFLQFCVIVTGSNFLLPEKSICEIFKQTLSNEQSKVDVVYFKSAKSASLASKVIKCASEFFSVRVVSFKNQSIWNKKLNDSTVLLLDSAENFRNIASSIDWLNNPERRQKHIVYAPNLTARDITKKIEDGFEIDQVAFLMNETTHSIDLVTSFMFTERACRQNQLETINRFNRTTLAWETRDFFPRKYKNIFKCRLTFMTNDKVDQKFDMFPTIAKIKNFSITRVLMKTPAFKFPLQGADLFVYDLRLLAVDNPPYVVSTCYNIVKVLWALPSGEPFTQFEKMFMMFDDGVWTGIGCTLLVFLITLRVISRLPIEVRNFVLGNGVQTPIMNLIEVFLCGGQYKVPRRNFARFILVLYVLWCLIFRTCYQSKLFEFLQSDIRKPRIESIADAKANNFTLSPPPLGRFIRYLNHLFI